MVVVHVISVVFGMGSALVSDVLFSFFSKDKKLTTMEISTLSILSQVVVYSLVVIFLSGTVLFLSDVDRYMNSAKFLSKMSILSVLLFNGYVLNKYIWPHLLNQKFFTLKKERNIRRLAFACGAVSVISWLAVCTLGVLDKLDFTYLSIILAYLLTIIFGVVVALCIEKKELN